MIINDLDGYYIVFDTKNWNTELDTLVIYLIYTPLIFSSNIDYQWGSCYQNEFHKQCWEH